MTSEIHFPLTEDTEASASFTLEASLLMGIILPVLLSLIYLGILYHDRGVLQSSACEIAALADCRLPESRKKSDLSDYANNLGKASVLASRDLTSSCSLHKDFIQVSYSGNMNLPGALPRLFGAQKLAADCSFSRKLFHPADTIRKIRGLEYLSDRLNGKEGASP